MPEFVSSITDISTTPSVPMKTRAERILSRMEHLKAGRVNWDTHWREVGDFILPNRNDFFFTRSAGEERVKHILDNTGLVANELLAGFLQGVLVNPSTTWFGLTTGDKDLDEDDDVRVWLQDTVRRMLIVINNSNFHTEVHPMFKDLTAFGTSVMSMEKDDKDVIRFSTKHLSTAFIDENNKGFIDAIYRRWKWSPKDIISEFGSANLPKEILDAHENGKGGKFEVIHAVFPRDIESDFKGNEKKFDSIYLVKVKSKPVEILVEGFDDFPFVVPRWVKAVGEMYGRSPGMTALPEVKMLNAMSETMIRGAQRVSDPPLQAPDDGFTAFIDARPGALNYFRSGTPATDRITPIFNDTRIDFGEASMENRRQRVRQAFFVDQLQLQDGPQKTATEVLQKTEESSRLLTAILGRMQHEFLRPTADRIFNIMDEREMFLPVPAALEGVPLDVRFESMLAKAQRARDGQAILRTVEAAAPFIELDPSVADLFHGDNTVREIADIEGYPQRGIRTKEEIDQRRQSRAEAQQRAVEQQEAESEAGQAQQLGQAVGQVAAAS